MNLHKKIDYMHFDSIDSTNTWAKRNAHLLNPDQLTCITALEQTAGRGRFSRRWLSPRGKNIYTTLYFCVPVDYPYLMNLGQVLALSCISVLQTHGFEPKVKWPNDILLNGKKAGGILCETTPHDGSLGVILGIGLNVNMTKEILDTIDQPATSLAHLSGRTFDLEQILEPMLQQFLQDLDILEGQGFKAFAPRFESLLAFRGERISCQDGFQTLKGICHSINTEGRLNLLMEDNTLRTLSSGELSTFRPEPVGV